MCRTLEVSTSGFYVWLRRGESLHAHRDRQLTILIEGLFGESRGTYGAPRLHQKLRGHGQRCGRKRVARLMREAGLRTQARRRARVRTTDSNHSLPVAPNVLQRDFQATAPNRVWVSDITYIGTDEGWLFLAATMDLFSRRIVGWSMSTAMPAALVVDALRMAIEQRCPKPGLTHHSDRGCQYASAEFRTELARHGIVASMSRKGDCYDNAAMESFNHTLKTELVHRQHYRTIAEARAAVFDYIESFYNRERSHSSLNYRSPAEFERQADEGAQVS